MIDATVWVALISATTSVLLAVGGAALQRRKQESQSPRPSLEAHPVFSLQDDPQLKTRCVDPARASLFDDLASRVLLEPVCARLRELLAEGKDAPRFVERVLALRPAIARAQDEALAAFPLAARDALAPVLRLHRETLEPLADAARSGEGERGLEIVFSIVHVATFAALLRWASASAQINGHLNGVQWRGGVLQYVARGNMDDVACELAAAASILEAVGPCFAYVAVEGRVVSATDGARRFLGRAPAWLRGRTPPVISQEDDASFVRLPRDGGDAQGRHFEAPLLVLQSDACRCSVGLCCDGSVDADDAHTRFAFLMLMLTAPQQHSVTLSRLAPPFPLVDRCWLGGETAPALVEGLPLHEQLRLSCAELQGLTDRCARRLQDDHLLAGTVAYAGPDRRAFEAEVFLLGGRTLLLAAHRAQRRSNS